MLKKGPESNSGGRATDDVKNRLLAFCFDL